MTTTTTTDQQPRYKPGEPVLIKGHRTKWLVVEALPPTAHLPIGYLVKTYASTKAPRTVDEDKLEPYREIPEPTQHWKRPASTKPRPELGVDRALRVLIDLGEASRYEWQAAAEMPVTTFKRARNALLDSGRVEEQDGRYRPTEQGKEPTQS